MTIVKLPPLGQGRDKDRQGHSGHSQVREGEKEGDSEGGEMEEGRGVSESEKTRTVPETERLKMVV